jgi:thioredoxin reductase
MYDAIIVGGGPAGLSAALILARCRREVLICDAGHPRNAASQALHGYLTRDGMRPADFLQAAREQLRPYGVEFRQGSVVDAKRLGEGFEVRLDDGTARTSRKLLLATGMVDHVPAIPGMRELYGRSILHCPYCDGWEVRDRPLAVYGRGAKAASFALAMKTWSEDLVLCTDGPTGLRPDALRRLQAARIAVRSDKMTRMEATGDSGLRIVFVSGDALARHAVFLSTAYRQRSDLAEQLGCHFTHRGAVHSNSLQGTAVPGLYVAGDAARDVQLIIVAAAEGAKAGFAIHKALQEEDGQRVE